jgi:type VII secretion protein EccB
MASTPTTKSQVQAYKFVLKRMESALVRKDAVMLHDPIGSHKRATVAGAMLAVVAMIGFLVWGLFGGKGSVPEPGAIVIGKESGSVYVVTADEGAPKRLTPMLNMASAKLLVMAQGGGGGKPVQPTTVKEAALAEFPRGPRTGMVNAPNYLPDAKNGAMASWAICDVAQVRNSVSDATAANSAKVETTVIGGDDHHGTPMAPNQSLYVQDSVTGQRYLIYAPHKVPGHGRVVKAAVDTSDKAVMDVYGLNRAQPRRISTNMLNAVPNAALLKVPNIDGDRVPYNMGGGNFQVGDVVQRSVAGERPQFFLLLQDGKQEISSGAAAVLHAEKNRSKEIPNATGRITDVDDTKNPRAELDAFPEERPVPVSFQNADTSCLSWNNVGGEHHVEATINKGTPAAKPPVKLARYDGAGPNVDFFYMPAGKAAVVRGTTSEAGSGIGPMYLVSDQGVRYGIKDPSTAQGLGVIGGPGDIKDGPQGIMKTLPTGDFLDPAQASFVYDSIPVPPGGVNRPAPKPQAGGAG